MRKENEKGTRWKGRGERSQVWRKGTGQRIERKESLKMKDCIIKKKVRKGKTQKEKHKRKATKGKPQKKKPQKKKPQRKKQSFVAFIICACFYKNLNL